MSIRSLTKLFNNIRTNKTLVKDVTIVLNVPLWEYLYCQLIENIDTIKNLISIIKELQDKEFSIFNKDCKETRKTLIKEHTSSIKEFLQNSKYLIDKIKIILKNNEFSINIEKGILYQLNNLIRQLNSNQLHYDNEIKLMEKRKKDLTVYFSDDIEPIMENKELQKTKLKSNLEKDVLENEMVIKERDKQLDNVIESLTEILKMFDEFNSIVVRQGDLLNRIDYNINMTNENVKEAVISLKVAEEADNCGKLTCFLIVLIILTVFLILIISIKLLIKFIH